MYAFTQFSSKSNRFHSYFKWCRSGVCVLKTAAFEKYTAYSKSSTSETSEKTNLIDESRKFGNLMKSEHSINRPILVNFDKNKKTF